MSGGPMDMADNGWGLGAGGLLGLPQTGQNPAGAFGLLGGAPPERGARPDPLPSGDRGHGGIVFPAAGGHGGGAGNAGPGAGLPAEPSRGDDIESQQGRPGPRPGFAERFRRAVADAREAIDRLAAIAEEAGVIDDRPIQVTPHTVQRKRKAGRP